MRTCIALMVFLILAAPSQSVASGPELFAVSFKRAQPSAKDDLVSSLNDANSLVLALENNKKIMLHVSQIKYRVVGRSEPTECVQPQCNALALMRAQRFQEALMRAGVPQSAFCSPLALGAPWPLTYQAKPEELKFARQATVEPMFDGCAPNNSFKPTPLRGAA